MPSSSRTKTCTQKKLTENKKKLSEWSRHLQNTWKTLERAKKTWGFKEEQKRIGEITEAGIGYIPEGSIGGNKGKQRLSGLPRTLTDAPTPQP